jgi:hypothetical protein
MHRPVDKKHLQAACLNYPEARKELRNDSSLDGVRTSAGQLQLGEKATECFLDICGLFDLQSHGTLDRNSDDRRRETRIGTF